MKAPSQNLTKSISIQFIYKLATKFFILFLNLENHNNELIA